MASWPPLRAPLPCSVDLAECSDRFLCKEIFSGDLIIFERLAPSTSLTPTGGISNQWSAVLNGLFRALNKHKNYTVDLVTRVDNVSIDRINRSVVEWIERLLLKR